MIRYPPEISVKLSWRQLYRTGAFGQRELVTESSLNQAAKDRSIRFGIGQGPFEDLDKAGPLQPIAFANGGYWTGASLPAVDEGAMTFREEVEAVAWQQYAWDAHGVPTVSAIYSPWQALYLDDVAAAGGSNVPLETLLLPPEQREKALASLEGWYENLDNSWRGVDGAWRPLIKVLVALQNGYWPFVSGRVSVIADRKDETGWIEAGRAAEPVPSARLLDQLGCDVEELITAYYFLVERGLNREPRDGLVMVRRARPRAFHVRWRGSPRRAQDHFDAAEVLRLFLVDLTGKPVPGPEAELMDGRQGERAALYEHGPAAAVDREKLKQELIAAELYPHGVEAMVEGPSEKRLVEVLVTELLGPQAAGELNFFELGGSGSADKIMPLASSLGAYALRAVVIVDSEGKTGSYAKRAIELGVLPSEDLCLAERSLEEDNASADELVELAKELAANPPEGREPVELSMTGDGLLSFHDERAARLSRHDRPGMAGSLNKLAERHQPPTTINKVDLAAALARRLVSEFQAAAKDEESLEALYQRRPVLGFVVNRVIGAINRPVPLG